VVRIFYKKYTSYSITSKCRLAIFAVYGTKKIITFCTDKEFSKCAGVPKGDAGEVEGAF
jgi:hypothetical protein